MPKGEFSIRLRVYIEDTDAGGIVYYVNYLKFMERCRTEFMRSLGYSKSSIFNQDLMFVVSHVDVKYMAPAVLDDELVATARVVDVGGASMTLHQAVRRNEEIMAQGEIKIACVDTSGVKPRRIPKDMLAQLRAA